MKATRKSIETFLSSRKLAIAGVSRDPKKFGHSIFKELKEKGFEVYPVNPNTDNINGTPCFHSISALPLDVRSLVILTPKPQTLQLVKDAVEKGMDNIWIQQLSETKESLAYLSGRPLNLVSNECILMWIEPVKSVHKFHKTIRKIFGLLPA